MARYRATVVVTVEYDAENDYRAYHEAALRAHEVGRQLAEVRALTRIDDSGIEDAVLPLPPPHPGHKRRPTRAVRF